MMVYFVGLISIVYLILYYFTRTFNYWNNKHVKGPTPIPFFGNFIDIALRRKNIGVIYREIYDKYPNEKVVGIYRMTTPILIIRNLDIVKQILIKDFEAFADRGIEFSGEKLGDNFFHCNSNTWRLLRNHFTPAFTAGKLRSMFYLLNERSDKFIDCVKNECMKQPDQNVYKLFRKYTIATAMAAFFDIDIDTFNNTNKLFDFIDKSMLKPSYFIELDMLYPGIVKKYNFSILSKLLNKFCYEVTQIINRERSTRSLNRGDIMDSLLRARRNGNRQNPLQREGENNSILKITDSLIAGQVFALYIAGHLNNAFILSFCMYYIAQNTYTQNRLIAEIDELLQKNDGNLTYDSLKQMKYLDMVMGETLRIQPLTNAITRAASRDYKIPGTDITIEKGTTVIISPYAIQHDEKYYPDPKKFDPERFSSEMARSRIPCAYLPFGAGPRGCVGTQFAKMQFSICVVKLLSQFRVEISSRTKPINKFDPQSFLLSPSDELHLKVIPRCK